MLKQRHHLFVILLVIADAFIVTLACFLAWCIRRELIERFEVRQWETWLKEPLVLFAVPIVIASMWALGMYRPRRDRSLSGEIGHAVKAALSSVAALVVFLWLVGNRAVSGDAPYRTAKILGVDLEPGRLQLVALALILPVMLGLHRFGFRLFLRFIRRRGWNLRHVLVIGVGRLGQITCRTLDRNSWTGIHVGHFLSHHDTTKRTQCLNRPVQGGLNDLEAAMERLRPDAVYLAIPTSRASVVPGVLKRLERYSVSVRIVPDVHPRYLPQSMVVNELDGMPILSYRESPLYGVGGITKRLVDMLGSLVGILIFGPLMLVILALVKFTSPGPVIFRQRRVSLGGQKFNIYKFRTMYYVEDERAERPEWTRRDDPRITPVGRWLRRTSLDELPQLFNVLFGEMSLVGPRPERPELIAQFREDWRGYMLRQHAKAGITGWAQVNGLRGDTSLKKRLQYDLFYIRHWSLWFDLKILWLTLFRGFVHRNAH